MIIRRGYKVIVRPKCNELHDVMLGGNIIEIHDKGICFIVTYEWSLDFYALQ